MTVAKKYNLALNEDKCTYSSNSVHLLGYIIQDGMFVHYCRWIPGFSKKIRPLLEKKQFTLSRDAVLTFNSLKDDVANAALATTEDDIPFRV
ncbi:putative retrovirus-related pol polyprotein from transposon opus [Trichonephila clavipes]|nr:putative retrovirus-related pol polyprotein from transposon opus [Trichonephila clavipes]